MGEEYVEEKTNVSCWLFLFDIGDSWSCTVKCRSRGSFVCHNCDVWFVYIGFTGTTEGKLKKLFQFHLNF